MSTVTTIRILFIATGILFLVIDFLVYVRKKLTTGIGLTWGLFSIAMILAGVYPGPVRIALNYIIALVFVGGLLFLFLVFRVSMLLSELKMRNQELAMQVSLLNQENEQILNKMGMLLNEEKNTIRD